MRKSNDLFKTVELFGNIFLIIICICVLSGAFMIQFYYYELPCPLCILQRIGFIGIMFGLLLNLKFGYKPIHHSIILLSGLFTSFVALRQIVLHIIPGTGAYGSAFLGLHLYTWSFIVSMTIVVLASILLGIERESYKRKYSSHWKLIVNCIFALVAIIVGMNIVSTFLECGLFGCPDNPTQYQYPL